MNVILKTFKHLASQPFIVATGFAALIHSTWSLGTFFSGEQPSDPVHYVLWLVPALLIAFSLDIGQIVTSAEIRDGQRSKAKYITFAVFAAATYFLQFVYISSHMPQVSLAAGVRSGWADVVSFIRDSGVFIIPALLPLSTLLYTFSQNKTAPAPSAEPSKALALVPQDDPVQIETPRTFEIECEKCEWGGVYTTPEGARAALRGHSRVHAE